MRVIFNLAVDGEIYLPDKLFLKCTDSLQRVSWTSLLRQLTDSFGITEILLFYRSL
jgi:hypothetical protein